MKVRLKIAWSWLAAHFQIIAICLTVPGIAWAIYSQREALANFDWGINPGQLALSIFLLALAPLFQAASFWDALRAFGPKPRLVEVALVWSRSFLLRYSPGGALAYLYRVKAKDRLQASNKEVLAATAYEQYAALQGALTVAFFAFLLDGGSIPILAIGLFSAGLLIALLARPSLLGGAVEKILLNRGVELPRLLQGRRVLPIVAFNLISWTSASLGSWFMLESLAPDAKVSLLFFIGAFSLACAVGIIVPMLPGGLGVREAMLVLLLSPALSAGVATAVAIGLRVVATIAEFVAIGLAEISYLGEKRMLKDNSTPQEKKSYSDHE